MIHERPRASKSAGADAISADTKAAKDASSDENRIAGLARGLAVMRAFANQHERLTLSEISRLVDLPRATARRCLITLHWLGYVGSDGKYFWLSPLVLTFSQAYFSSNALPQIAHRYAEEVSDATGVSCSVSVLSGDAVVYVARSALRRRATRTRDVGTQVPAYSTAMGRVLLSNLTADALDAYFSRVVLTKFAQDTVTDRATLQRILKQVRRDDFCLVTGEMEHDLRALAVPVRNASGQVVAALHVGTEAGRMSREEMLEKCLPVLRNAASHMQPLLIG